jgi:ABC-2 type transport system permease protein
MAYQNRLFMRTPIAAFFTLLLPLIMLLLFTAIFDGVIETEFGPVSYAQYYAPALAVFSAASATYTNLGVGIPIYRDDGILKRIRSTPLPPILYLIGATCSAILIAALGATLMMGVGAVFFDVGIEAAKIPAAVLAFVVGTATFAALGIALAALVPNASSAPAVTNATLLPIAFVSGVFIPLEDAPAWVETLGDIFPLKHFLQAFSAPFVQWTEAPAIEWGDLAVMIVWMIGGLIVAIRYFKWDPVPGSSTTRGRRSRVASQD